MAESAKTSGWIWLLTFLLIYLIAITLFVGMVVKADTIQETLISERSSNISLAASLDEAAWALSQGGGFFSSIADKTNKRILSSNAIVDGKTGIVEEIWDETPLKISLYATLLDYRLSVIGLLIPSMLAILMAALIDGGAVRKIQLYKNSFSSPLKHTLGGKVLGLNLGILIFCLFFIPMTLPFWVFVLAVLVKSFGWWLWIVNLPKRM
jgi:hypothetical protein